MVITVESGSLKKGDNFTIEGYGYSKKGDLILGGINPKTNRKNKIVKPKIFTVIEILDNGDVDLGKPFKELD